MNTQPEQSIKEKCLERINGIEQQLVSIQNLINATKGDDQLRFWEYIGVLVTTEAKLQEANQLLEKIVNSDFR